MAKLKKLLNANYLHHEVPTQLAVNENNRVYIDRFVSENYKSLSRRFAAIGSNINSSGFGALDKLNETLCSLYTNPDLHFASWEEAKVFLQNKFTEKEMRVPLKKRNESELQEDKTEEPVPDEIKDMFADLSQAEKHFEFVKPKRETAYREIYEIEMQRFIERNEHDESW